jgi:hypothetical protein
MIRFTGMTTVLLFCSGAALATPPAISLFPMQGDKALNVVQAKNVTGSCGSAVVRVLGVTNASDGFYENDSDSGIIIRSGGKELNISEGGGDILSDHNGVACVPTKSGKRLLVWSNCAGSACGDNFSFFVFDPERLALIAPKDPRKEQCDENCASRILGSSLPQQINGRN